MKRYAASAKNVFWGLFSSLCLIVFFFLFLDGCNLQSDAKLKDVFNGNPDDFRRLAVMSDQDSDLKRVSLSSPRPRDIAVPDNRWKEYQVLFQKLGIKEGLVRRDDFPTVVFFRAECNGSAITHDCKGYAYSKEPLKPIQDNLDAPPAKVAFRPLSHNWYLFRDDG